MKDQFPINAVPSGIEPWQMWGSSTIVDLSTANSIVGVQLARVNYKRPETWSFFMFARILAMSMTQPLTVSVVMLVQFGIGRTFFSTPLGLNSANQAPFLEFTWSAIPAGTLIPNLQWNPKWATASPGSPLNTNAAAIVTAGQPCSWLPAQDIQCGFQAVGLSAAAYTAKVEIGAFFAPRTHIRPDWFMEQFPGGELGGT